jgi:hypothetical protein
MATPANPLPMTAEAVVDTYFMEHRAKLLDIAAFLDRVDRAAPAAAEADFRVAALRACIPLLADGQSDRVRRILEALSDHSGEPLASAAGMKGAAGAPPPRETH